MTDSTDPLGTPTMLAAYFVEVGDVVEVEIRTAAQYPGDFGPRIVEGTVLDASDRALLIKTLGLSRHARIPWDAIAVIRNSVSTTPHPAL